MKLKLMIFFCSLAATMACCLTANAADKVRVSDGLLGRESMGRAVLRTSGSFEHTDSNFGTSMVEGSSSYLPTLPAPPANGDASPNQYHSQEEQKNILVPSVSPYTGTHPTSNWISEPSRGTYTAALESAYPTAVPFGPVITLDKSFGDGLGFEGNYYQLRSLFPKHIDVGRSLLFAMLNISVTEDGKASGNFGLGIRTYYEEVDRILSAAGFFDFDEGNVNDYYRAGFSLESLGQVDTRVNGYLVLNEEFNTLSAGVNGSPFFQGNNIAFNFIQAIEAAYSGLDCEIGGPLPLLGRSGFKGYLGAYYLDAEGCKETVGFQARLEAAISDDITAGVRFTEDDVFGTNAWASVAVTIPDGKRRRWFRTRPVKERMSAPIVRSDRIHVNRREESSTFPTTNPSDSQSFFVFHVDTDATAGGDGSIETPFSTLEAARIANNANVDIIRVLPGSAASFAMAGPLDLFDGQRLLSTTLNHNLIATQGTFTVPGFTGGIQPQISNSSLAAAAVVRLANSNEVSGFTIDGSSQLHDGISATNVSGSLINGNVIQNSLNGVQITASNGLLNGETITDNNISGSLMDGINVIATAGSTVNLTATGNTITSNERNGIGVDATDGASNLVIGGSTVALGNTISNNVQQNIDLLLQGAHLGTLTIQNNTIDGGVGSAGNVNISRLPNDQDESAIAINPTNPDQLFAFSNDGRDSMFAARSDDGGATWLPVSGDDFVIADGNDVFPVACCDPTVTYDQFGNLFIGYLDQTANANVILLSTDGGATFQTLASLPGTGGGVDQPTIATGPGSGGVAGSVWVTYFDNASSTIVVEGTTVSGLGTVGAFSGAVAVPGGVGQQFGDIVVGPNGQVVVTYQDNALANSQGPNEISLNIDSDGLANGINFGPSVVATTTNVGSFDSLPAQATRTVDAEAGLVFDRSGGPFDGRLYLAYTDETVDENNDFDIFVRFSDDNGATFSAPVRVNDDAGTNSQFLPRIALDQTSGNIAVGFYDARNDFGAGGVGDTNGIVNDDAQFFASASLDGGLTFLSNVQISLGTSNSAVALNTNQQFGDYTGLAFEDGIFRPTWADNSNSTGDNPDGTLSGLDIYTAQARVASGSGITLLGDEPNTVGANIRITVADTATLGTVSVPALFLDNTIINAGAEGVLLNVSSPVSFTGSIVNNLISGNMTDGFSAIADGGAITFSAFDNNAITNNGSITTSVIPPSAPIGNGVSFATLNTGTITGSIINSAITGNMLDGFSADVNTGSIMLSAFDNNSITGNQANGFDVATSNAGVFTSTTISNNQLSNNVAAGINVSGDTGTVNLGTISDNSLNRLTAGTAGILVNTTGVAVTATATGNQFIGGNANTSLGIDLQIDAGTLDLTVGGPDSSDMNTFDANVGAGIAVTLQNTASGTFTIENNSISRTTDDGDATTRIIGEGIHVGLVGSPVLPTATPSLTNWTISSNIIGDMTNSELGNAGGGIRVYTEEDATTDNLILTKNLIANNSNTGIQFHRRDNAVVNSASLGVLDNVNLVANVIDSNAGNGIDILAQNGTLDDLDFSINDNQITNNTSDGISLRVEADAQIQVDITRNLIDANSGNGILTTENINVVQDLRDVSGTWTKNIITNNSGHGISSNATTGVGAGITVGLIGIDPVDGMSFGNLIDLNGLDGIEINSSGGATFTNNVITRNGILALEDPTQGAGVDIQGANFKNLTFIENVIEDNRGDGMEILNSSPLFTVTVTALRNAINLNDGRGVDILNQGNRQTTVSFTDNDILSNALQGFYVVNTASLTQDQIVAASDDLLADGTITPGASPNLTLSLQGNTISHNNLSSDFEIGGLAVRVGTSVSGMVTASVENNTFQGNLGHDVGFESFTSTVDPADTEADPLARLNLEFRNNTGNSMDVTQLGAFYNNADGIKSPAPTLESDARRRNATRESGFVVTANGTVVEPAPFQGTVVDPPIPLANEFAGNDELSAVDDFFNGRDLTFTAGVLNSQTQTVADYTGDSKLFNFDPSGFLGAPVADDTFEISRLPLASVFDATTLPIRPGAPFEDADLAGRQIRFTSGGLVGDTGTIANYVQDGAESPTGTLVFGTPFMSAPLVGDTFLLEEFAAGGGPSTFTVNADANMVNSFTSPASVFIFDDSPYVNSLDANGEPFFPVPIQVGELPFGWGVLP